MIKLKSHENGVTIGLGPFDFLPYGSVNYMFCSSMTATTGRAGLIKGVVYNALKNNYKVAYYSKKTPSLRTRYYEGTDYYNIKIGERSRYIWRTPHFIETITKKFDFIVVEPILFVNGLSTDELSKMVEYGKKNQATFLLPTLRVNKETPNGCLFRFSCVRDEIYIEKESKNAHTSQAISDKELHRDIITMLENRSK